MRSTRPESKQKNLFGTNKIRPNLDNSVVSEPDIVRSGTEENRAITRE